jgi:hypothetical protein
MEERKKERKKVRQKEREREREREREKDRQREKHTSSSRPLALNDILADVSLLNSQSLQLFSSLLLS